MTDSKKRVDTGDNNNNAAIIALVVLLIVGGFIYAQYISYEKSQVSSPTTQTITPTTQVNMMSDLIIGKKSESTDDAGYRHIYVDVANSGAVKTSVFLTATLYDSNDSVIGTALGTISNLGRGETKTADITVVDSGAKEYVKYKVDLTSSY